MDRSMDVCHHITWSIWVKSEKQRKGGEAKATQAQGRVHHVPPVKRDENDNRKSKANVKISSEVIIVPPSLPLTSHFPPFLWTPPFPHPSDKKTDAHKNKTLPARPSPFFLSLLPSFFSFFSVFYLIQPISLYCSSLPLLHPQLPTLALPLYSFNSSSHRIKNKHTLALPQFLLVSRIDQPQQLTLGQVNSSLFHYYPSLSLFNTHIHTQLT